ncbi:MAG: hypothetical protein A2805_02745 [Candidatus Andersenbacteria bacterium RIFCSPHIGHO2_01_FULL_46_36]|nr:MAG: hypothetical protein A2805_02745 [Candidatus Andersenbacteria bacterium RIFCSPHIGHO2_01_FULL_46_36]
MEFGPGHPQYPQYLRFQGLLGHINRDPIVPIGDIKDSGLKGLWDSAVAAAISVVSAKAQVPACFATGWTGSLPQCPNASGEVVSSMYRLERLQQFERIGTEYFDQFRK